MTADREQADPYVVGLALELATDGHTVTVITEDVRDRLPTKSSMSSACEALNVPWQGLQHLLDALT
ncbi:MAG: hypothetical protein WKF86_00400 [Acidimicrobiales bacterium]